MRDSVVAAGIFALTYFVVSASLPFDVAHTVAPPKPDPLAKVRDCADGPFVPSPALVWTAHATAIIDGDSFCMGAVEIRTQRWNAPEWNEPGGERVAADLAALLAAYGPLTCEAKARSYDRVIARCSLSDGTELRSAMRAIATFRAEAEARGST
ncbi:MAG: hypothetical protein AAFY47_05265 [Pseudomonadota bacterium]